MLRLLVGHFVDQMVSRMASLVILSILPMVRVYDNLEMQCRYNIWGYKNQSICDESFDL